SASSTLACSVISLTTCGAPSLPNRAKGRGVERRQRVSNEPTLVVLGASGDLANRLLFPALLSLEHRDRLAGLRIIGYARQEWTTDQFHENLRAAIDLGGAEYEDK